MLEETVSSAESHLERIQKEYEQTSARLNSKIEGAKIINLVPYKINELQEQRRVNDALYAQSEQAARERIDAAKTREKKIAEEKEAKRAEVESAAKQRALRAWTNAGGDSAGFESAWPEIRRAQLSEAVLQKMRDNNDLSAIIRSNF